MTLEYLRSFRFAGFAIFDFGLAYFGVYLLVPTLNKVISPTKRALSHSQWLMLVLPLSVIFHLMFGSRTPLTNLALAPDRGYLFKLMLILMIYLGSRKNKKWK